MLLLTIACCCGVPAYYGKPYWEQYPASVSLPTEVAGFDLRDDPASKKTAEELKIDARTDHLFAEKTFAGLYRDSDDKRLTIFGSTGFRFSPDKDLDAEIDRLTERYNLTNVRPVEMADRGAYQQCGTGRSDGDAVVLCSWADHGSLVTTLFSGRSVEESAQLSTELRSSIVKHDWGDLG